jgi:hypothetical protein
MDGGDASRARRPLDGGKESSSEALVDLLALIPSCQSRQELLGWLCTSPAHDPSSRGSPCPGGFHPGLHCGTPSVSSPFLVDDARRSMLCFAVHSALR